MPALAAALDDARSRPATEDDLLARHPRLKLEWLMAPDPLRRRIRAVLRANAGGPHAHNAAVHLRQDQALGLLYAWPEAFRRLDLGAPEFHPAAPARLKRLLADQFALETGSRPTAHRDIRPLLAVLDGAPAAPHAKDAR